MKKLNNIFTIKILPERRNNKYEGASLKGALYLAMEQQIKARLPYDEIWLVTDNDEGNSYKLSDNSLRKIKDKILGVQYDILEREQKEEIKNVRISDSNTDEDTFERVRYFLYEEEYYSFLDRKGIDEEFHQLVVENTEKSNEFERLYAQDYHSFFYDDNGNFISANNSGTNQEKYKERYFQTEQIEGLNIAYACISIEYWILLHFELCEYPFYNSREIIKYFDDSSYFIEKSITHKDRVKGEKDFFFKKGWFFYEHREKSMVKNFFTRVDFAIHNSLILNSFPHSKRKHYEINPYSDVHILAGNLLSLSVLNLDEQIQSSIFNESFLSFNNILIKKIDVGLEVSFSYKTTAPALWKNIESSFNLRNVSGALIDVRYERILEHGDDHNIIRYSEREPDKRIKLNILFDTLNGDSFLYLNTQKNGIEFRAICHIK